MEGVGRRGQNCINFSPQNDWYFIYQTHSHPPQRMRHLGEQVFSSSSEDVDRMGAGGGRLEQCYFLPSCSAVSFSSVFYGTSRRLDLLYSVCLRVAILCPARLCLAFLCLARLPCLLCPAHLCPTLLEPAVSCPLVTTPPVSCRPVSWPILFFFLGLLYMWPVTSHLVSCRAVCCTLLIYSTCGQTYVLLVSVMSFCFLPSYIQSNSLLPFFVLSSFVLLSRCPAFMFIVLLCLAHLCPALLCPDLLCPVPLCHALLFVLSVYLPQYFCSLYVFINILLFVLCNIIVPYDSPYGIFSCAVGFDSNSFGLFRVD